jgi:hypothetical protein
MQLGWTDVEFTWKEGQSESPTVEGHFKPMHHCALLVKAYEFAL